MVHGEMSRVPFAEESPPDVAAEALCVGGAELNGVESLMVDFKRPMSRKPSREIVSRVIRPGEQEPPDSEDWSDATPDERIEAVWTLTKACMA